jgi:hypothetical protein
MMTTRIQGGTMMIREGFLLQDLAGIESVDYSNTWRRVPGMDSCALDRSLGAAGWHLFFIAGELKVIEVGWGASAIHRGLKRILARGRKSSLNCMEITEVRSEQFLGLPYIAICAHSFHIQNNTTLLPAAERKSEQQDRDWACG